MVHELGECPLPQSEVRDLFGQLILQPQIDLLVNDPLGLLLVEHFLKVLLLVSFFSALLMLCKGF